VPADGGTGGGNAGRGGNVNTGGMAGTSIAGSGGMAGTGGIGGSSGSAGTAGVPNDAGTDAAIPDGGGDAEAPLVFPTGTREEIVSSVCLRFAQVASCGAVSATCEDDLTGELAFYDKDPESCAEVTDAFFGCLVGDPINFECNPDSNVPSYILSEAAGGRAGATNTCPDEEAAWLAALLLPEGEGCP
jgi:hypothetical protein